jgi:hypothetical protein
LKFRLSSLVTLAAILGLVLLVAGCILTSRGGLLNILYPLVTLLVGGLLYTRYPSLYVGFVWWLWFLTPEVRRLVDWQSGYQPESTVALTPFLVTGLTFFTLLRHSPKLQNFPFLPIGMAVVGLLYGFAVGVMKVGVFAVAFDLLNWIVPVLFAFYLLVHWRDYPDYRRVTQRTFAWGVLLLGLYALLQFFVVPTWDRVWMDNAEMTSIGKPEPFEVRVWSTLNSPGPFANVIMAGLLVLLSSGAPRYWPALVAGVVSFLLSLVRSTWGAFVVGLWFLATHRSRSRPRLLATLAVVGLLLWPLVTIGPVADAINTRVETLGNIQGDTSFQERLAFYGQVAPRAFLNPLGEGLGNTGIATRLSNEGPGPEVFDSGIMAISLALGWPGTFLYAGGLIWLSSHALRGTKRPDTFAAASRGIFVGMLALLLYGNIATGVSGMLLWYFLSLAVAARVFYAQDAEGGGERGGFRPDPQSRST